MGEYKPVKTGRLLRGGVMPVVKYDPKGKYATPQNNWEKTLLPAQPYPQGTVLVIRFQGVNAAKEWASLLDSMNPDSNFGENIGLMIERVAGKMLDLLNKVLGIAGRERIYSLNDPVHFELVRERGVENSVLFSEALRATFTLLKYAEIALPSLVKLPEKNRISGLFITSVYTPRDSASAPLRQDMSGTPPPAEPAESRIYDWAKDVF
jgi:hypothetical protein